MLSKRYDRWTPVRFLLNGTKTTCIVDKRVNERDMIHLVIGNTNIGIRAGVKITCTSNDFLFTNMAKKYIG